MPPGDADAIVAMTLARDIEDELQRNEMFLAVALISARKARALIEDNADLDADQQRDALVLARVYAHLLDVVSGLAPVAGTYAARAQARDLVATLEEAATERPPALRLVK